MAEVSVTPGRGCANICHSRLVRGMPDPRSSDMRVYWLPMSPWMFSQLGFAGSAGGFRGSKAIWHEPHVVPIRNGGSTDASASLVMRSSEGTPVCCIVLRKPSHVVLPAFTWRHFPASKRGFGNL